MFTKKLNLLPLLASLCVLVLTACPGDNEKDPAPKVACQLQEQRITETGQEKNPALYTYTYNSQNLPITVTLDSAFTSRNVRVKTFNLTYNADKRLQTINMAVADPALGSDARFELQYNASGQLVKQLRYNQGASTPRDYYDYFYNAAGELTEIRYYFGSTSSQPMYSWKLSYTNGNPTQVQHYDAQGQLLSGTSYTFDAKPAPQAPVPFTFLAPIDNLPRANNIISATTTNAQGNTNGYTVAYTYNTQGYPTAYTKTYRDGYTQTAALTYTCE